MTGNSNNNNRQIRQVVVPRDRDRTWQRTIGRGRNSPLPNRNFKGGQPGSRIQTLPIGESNWYKISVSDNFIISQCNFIYTLKFKTCFYF